ncbi:BEL1-like homeodomain protein 4 [Silene latifolia]|uniref:BEL1-like homeodomain protein 4 n=1 Tax=Silene latifolia TaxID=37657 RepID=UPI003D7786CC
MHSKTNSMSVKNNKTVFTSTKFIQLPSLSSSLPSSSSPSPSSSVCENSMTQDYHHHQPQPHNIFAFPDGFERTSENPSSTTNTVDPTARGINPAYETAGLLSEMFNYGPNTVVPNNIDPPHQWYGDHHGGANNSAAAAMQLFLTQAPPPSPPPRPPSEIEGSSVGGFHSMGVNTLNNNLNFWGAHHHHHQNDVNNPGELSGMIEGQGLSLSLSSSLQHLEAAKQAEDHNQINQIMFFKNLSSTTTPNPITLHNLQPVGGFGIGSTSTSATSGMVNVLRNSKYVKPAQELLEEFCSVGRGHQLNKPKILGRQNSSNNPNSANSGGGGSVGGSSSKETPQLSPADKIEHQRRKIKLLAMLDEVDKRYNNYCEQMQMVVNSFDLVMGYGGAIPYTAQALKAMSRHFRCLKDAIHAQLKHSCELLGEKDPTASLGLTKGETPRLKILEQNLRQQRAFHQMGMMDQDAWRPQRGLPERSVNILRAWLFEHFLHPYPSDADKHLLARQTGLSRNQVSNWFINARVRLWKPMVEEMYQQESKDEDDDDDNQDDDVKSTTQTSNNSFPTAQSQPQPLAQNSIQSSVDTMHPTTPNSNTHPPNFYQHSPANVSELPLTIPVNDDSDYPHQGSPTTMIRFGSTTGDVSLTLGLHHTGSTPEKSAPFEVRNFGSC